MNMTNADSRVVASSADLIIVRFKRFFIAARTNDPTAPIAPPSVGVAMPRKIVPNTRKINASGGISTMITCCASRDMVLIAKVLSTKA